MDFIELLATFMCSSGVDYPWSGKDGEYTFEALNTGVVATIWHAVCGLFCGTTICGLNVLCFTVSSYRVWCSKVSDPLQVNS